MNMTVISAVFEGKVTRLVIGCRDTAEETFAALVSRGYGPATIRDLPVPERGHEEMQRAKRLMIAVMGH